MVATNKMKPFVFLTFLLLETSYVVSFAPTQLSARRSLATFAKKKKGFAKESSSSKKSETPPAVSAPTPVETAPSSTTKLTQESPPPLNAGQEALAKLRRQQAESKDAELRKVREMLQADRQVQESTAAIPEKVAQRMGKRMLPFVGLPLFLGMGTFVGFWYM